MWKFDTPEVLLREMKEGHMVILIDDENRENEGDLVLAADFVTPEAINFMAREARGLICLALEEAQIQRLKLPMMVRDDQNESPNRTAFTVSIEASQGVTTGISASDRAHTIRVASRPTAQAKDVRSPGHIFPLRAQSGGVLKRAGHTEGSVDLARMAGLNPAAVICEVMNEDGSMARVPDLFMFAKKHGIKIGTIVDLIEYRLQNECLVEETNRSILDSPWGPFDLRVFRSRLDGGEHLVLKKGELGPDPTLVRVQVLHPLKSVLGLFSRNPTETGLQSVLEMIGPKGGVVVLLSSEATRLTDQVQALIEKRSPFPMDERNYGTGAQILRALGLRKLKLISQSTHSPKALRGFDLEIVEWITPTSQSQGDVHEAWNRPIQIQ